MPTTNPYGVLPEELRDVVRGVIVNARKILEDGDRLQSMFLIGRLSEPGRWEFVPIATETTSQRAASAQHARQVAAATAADCVVHVVNGWTVPANDVSRHAEIIRRYGSLEGYPKRVDAATFLVETRRFGMFSAILPILAKPPSKRKRTIAEPSFSAVDVAMGRLTNILAPALQGQTLH